MSTSLLRIITTNEDGVFFCGQKASLLNETGLNESIVTSASRLLLRMTTSSASARKRTTESTERRGDEEREDEMTHNIIITRLLKYENRIVAIQNTFP